MAVFTRSIVVPAPIEDVYAFHLDTRNAGLIAGGGVEVVEVRGRFPVRRGDEVILRLRPRPLPVAQTWRVRIAELEPPRLLVDELVEGPFARFRHEHRFEDLGGARTRLTDRIDYALPGGAAGALLDRLVARRVLARAFAARQGRTVDVRAARTARRTCLPPG